MIGTLLQRLRRRNPGARVERERFADGSTVVRRYGQNGLFLSARLYRDGR